MNEEIQKEYDRLLIKLVLRHGDLVSERATTFGWRDYAETFPNDWYGRTFVEHLERCGIQSVGSVQEEIWYEFQGTFYEGDNSVHGVAVFGLTCNCGKLTNRSVRWSARMQEVAQAVFEEHLNEHPAKEGT